MAETVDITELEEPAENAAGWMSSATLEPAQAIEPAAAEPQEEAEQSRTVDQDLSDSLQLFLAQAARHQRLTAADEVTLAKRIEKDDLVAKRTMIESNLRLVV